jgi:hypothetical protein
VKSAERWMLLDVTKERREGYVIWNALLSRQKFFTREHLDKASHNTNGIVAGYISVAFLP